MSNITRTKDGKIQHGYKFSWLELIVNTKTGETSATGFCGIILISISMFLFTVMTCWYFFNMTHSAEIFELMDKLITLISIGAGLLGLRKLSGAFSNGSRISIGGGNNDDVEYHMHHHQINHSHDYTNIPDIEEEENEENSEENPEDEN